jgi:selenoprotein W-related protein
LAEEIIEEYGDRLGNITLVRGEGGLFEVEVDGHKVFSKKELKRHAGEGEVIEKIGRALQGNGWHSFGVEATQETTP